METVRHVTVFVALVMTIPHVEMSVEYQMVIIVRVQDVQILMHVITTQMQHLMMVLVNIQFLVLFLLVLFQ